MKSLASQLHAAMREKGWSVPRLLEESKLKCDRTSLQRKLKGKQKLSTEETEKLARVLGCTLAWMSDERRGGK